MILAPPLSAAGAAHSVDSDAAKPPDAGGKTLEGTGPALTRRPHSGGQSAPVSSRSFCQDACPTERRSWVATARCTLTARPPSRTTPAKVIAARAGLATPTEKAAQARYRLCRATCPHEAARCCDKVYATNKTPWRRCLVKSRRRGVHEPWLRATDRVIVMYSVFRLAARRTDFCAEAPQPDLRR
jgi:hypothetical protein